MRRGPVLRDLSGDLVGDALTRRVPAARDSRASWAVVRRPLPMDGAARIAFLRSLQADRIERIEYLPNPSARFEAEDPGRDLAPDGPRSRIGDEAHVTGGTASHVGRADQAVLLQEDWRRIGVEVEVLEPEGPSDIARLCRYLFAARQPLERPPAPAAAGLGQHAVVGGRVVQPQAAEPQPVQPQRQPRALPAGPVRDAAPARARLLARRRDDPARSR